MSTLMEHTTAYFDVYVLMSLILLVGTIVYAFVKTRNYKSLESRLEEELNSDSNSSDSASLSSAN